MKWIKISQLPLIKTPEQFFDVDKILMVDVLYIDQELYPTVADCVKEHPNGLCYDGSLYLALSVVASPENMYLNSKKMPPLEFAVGAGIRFKWNGDLNDALAKKKVYDFSQEHKKWRRGRAAIDVEEGFMRRRYVDPYPEPIGAWTPRELLLNV